MNKLPNAKRAAIIRALVDGASLRAVARMVGVDRETVGTLLAEVGEFAEVYQRHALVNLQYTKRIEIDEIWSFCGAKEANKTQEHDGDLWTYTAIDAESKLVFSWLVAKRGRAETEVFCDDIARRLPNRVQVSSDANHAYDFALASAFRGKEYDYGQIVKRYGSDPQKEGGRRYSPSRLQSIEKSIVVGTPDLATISTAYVERQNLTMRMQMRRFTRLTNAFSKSAERHADAVALHYLVYNFARVHGTLSKEFGRKLTPAMRAGVTDHVWTVEEILAKMDGDVMIGRAA